MTIVSELDDDPQIPTDSRHYRVVRQVPAPTEQASTEQASAGPPKAFGGLSKAQPSRAPDSEWDPPQPRASDDHADPAPPRGRPPRGPRVRRRWRAAAVRAAVAPRWAAAPALVGFALAAAFFAWVSAEPFWLSVGHSTTGTATVHSPGDPNVTSPAGTPGGACVVRFVAVGGAFAAPAVELVGPRPAACVAGRQLPARMVSRRGQHAYVTDSAGLTLRWIVGLALILACGVGVAWATGAVMFPRGRRRVAVALCFAGPLIIAVGLLAAMA